MNVQSHGKRHLTSFQIIIFGFAAVILLGALLLMLPMASQSHQVTPFREALFTSTSAVCVTGLVVQDTASYWSMFGQIIILVLIQVGGMGVITIAVSFALISGRKISLMQRCTMQEAIAAPKVGGIVRLTGFAIKATLVIELAGAVIMAPVFCRDYGVRGIWMALFHSVSAFCNAGFDLLGTPEARFASLTSYVDQPLINIVIMVLIVVGGLGFLTWNDIRTNGRHFRRYSMQSKVIIVTSAVLILAPALYFFFFEFGGKGMGVRLFSSIFQAVTPRTAGFNTVSLTDLSSTGRYLIVALMLIGGSPGSTAGGMKTTTIAVLFANALAVFKREENARFFRRRIENDVVRNASAIFLLYIILFFSGAVVISVIEGLPMGTCLFETASAVGTVGLSLGITPQLGVISHVILIALMFFGRVGGLTLIYAAISGKHRNISKLPREKIMVG